MDACQRQVAARAEKERLRLGLAQAELGVDPKTWREFASGEKWPGQARTRARIEARLGLDIGALERIAAGRSSWTRESITNDAPGHDVPEDLDTARALLNEIDDHIRSGQVATAIRKLGLVVDIASELRAQLTPPVAAELVDSVNALTRPQRDDRSGEQPSAI